MQQHTAAAFLFSLVLYYVLIAILFGIPVAKILHRTGYSRWLALLVLFPIVNLIGLWMFAWGPWTGELELPDQRGRNRERDQWSEGDKEVFRRLVTKSTVGG
jgi:hypothetical protein